MFICEYFMLVSHGVTKKACTQLSGFIRLLVLQVIIYQPSLLWSNRLLQKECIFKIKQSFSSNLLLIGFDFTVLRLYCTVLCFLGHYFSSAIMKLRIAWCLDICIGSNLASHQLMWYKKRIHRHGLKITSSFFCFCFPKKLSSRLMLPP